MKRSRQPGIPHVKRQDCWPALLVILSLRVAGENAPCSTSESRPSWFHPICLARRLFSKTNPNYELP